MNKIYWMKQITKEVILNHYVYLLKILMKRKISFIFLWLNRVVFQLEVALQLHAVHVPLMKCHFIGKMLAAL